MRHQRLVGGDDMLTVIERCVEHTPGDPIGAADQLNDDVDLGICRHRRCILVPADRGQVDTAITAAIACGNRCYDDPTAGALSEELGLTLQHLQGAGTDRTETGDGDLQRRFHDSNPDAVDNTPKTPLVAARHSL
jgi:hypothetical protein